MFYLIEDSRVQHCRRLTEAEHERMITALRRRRRAERLQRRADWLHQRAENIATGIGRPCPQ